MKKFFTLTVFTLLFCLVVSTKLKAQAVNQLYWAEGFDSSTSTISSSAPLVAGTTSTAVGYWAALPSGVWYVYGTYHTTGTSCGTVTEPSGSGITIGTGHLRMSKNIDPTAGNPSDSAWFVTPAVSYGIQEFHFVRNEASRSYKIYWTADTGAVTSNGVPTVWNLAVAIPSTTTTCVDTAIIIAQKTATRIKVLSGKADLNYDVDSIWETSVLTIVPVTFGGINAIASNGVIKVNWNIQTATNTKEYIVERSGDGKDFESIGTLGANGAANYNWIDNAPLSGTNFYKIEAVGIAGDIQYSTVVDASLGNDLPQQVVVAPNPVTNGQFNLELENFAKGDYTLGIYSTSGQQILSSVISHPGGTSSQPITLPAVAKGLYNVHIGSFNKTIVVE